MIDIYAKYGISEAILIGHSFGSIIAANFAEEYPEKIQSIILAGAPVSLQESFKTIISSCKSIYESKKDSTNLSYIHMLEKMDTTSYPHSSFSFMHAMQNGFYSTKNPTQEAKSIYQTFSKDSTFTKYAAQMTYNAPMAFWKNEKSTTLHLTETNQNLVKRNICIYGIYGQHDGLYSKKQINDLGSLIGSGNILNLENCSHSVFVDQQKQFISAGQNWTSK